MPLLGSRSRKTILTLKTPLLLNSTHLDIKNAFRPQGQGNQKLLREGGSGKKFNGLLQSEGELCDKPANKYDGNSLLTAPTASSILRTNLKHIIIAICPNEFCEKRGNTSRVTSNRAIYCWIVEEKYIKHIVATRGATFPELKASSCQI